MSSFRDRQLTEEQQQSLDRYWKNASNKEAVRLDMLAQNHIKAELELVENNPGYQRMCLASGTHLYRRKDGQPITSDDVEAVQSNWLGQENRVTQPDEMTIQRYWLCDSSD